MASLLIKNIPPQLHAELKQRAVRNRRSLNSETMRILEESVGLGRADGEAPAGKAEPPLSEAALDRLPPDIAARLRAVRELRSSLAERKVDFAAWRKTTRDARR